jgi:ABC-type polysaccharide/polyol phosphate transport system ATPase subunit
LRGVMFSVQPGTLVGIVGENGVGQTTLLQIVAGELWPNRGLVHSFGAIGYCP